jgi:hypothetical protein
MKLVVTPLLCLLVLSQAFSKWLIVMEYALNKEYIAQNLCLNKARPRMHCNGKCQLMKKLTEEEKQNGSNQSSQNKSRFQEVLFTSLHSVFPPDPSLQLIARHYQPYTVRLCTAPSPGIFHPPALI